MNRPLTLRILGGVTALLLLPVSAQPPGGSTPALADAYPPARLQSLLVPREAWKPFPARADREGWNGLPEEARQKLVRAAEEAQAKPLPALPATLYLRYAREGDRGQFEGPYFERRRRLHQLVLGECVEGGGRFLDAVADTLWAILEESTWCVPAHIGAQRAGVGLPDVDEPVVDLFAAQTASSVAWTLYLLGGDLDRVSPMIRRRAQADVDRRILTPYLGRDYGWMGFQSRGGADRPNNWNPWINGNVLTATLLLEPREDRRIALVHRVLRSLDRFLQPYPFDGGCDEGPGYWSRAGASVLDNLDLLLSASAGRLDAFGDPLIREMGRFIHRVHIADSWFVPIGDCAARMGIDRDPVFRFGRRLRDQPLQDLATQGATVDELVRSAGGIDLGRSLHTVFEIADIVAARDARPPLVRDAWLGSDDLQMMIARDRAGTTEGFFVAAWGGHNAQSHNHNDVGNVLVFADGQPVFIDLGAPTYTAKTFSRRRYEIPAMQSAWHNLPTLNGVMQAAGRAFAAREVSYAVGDGFAELGMDIAPAWPPEAKAAAWRRTVRLERGREVTLTEAFHLESVAPGPVLNFITPLTPVAAAPGHLELPLPATHRGPHRRVIVLFDADVLQARAEPFAVDDRRLEGIWGAQLVRLQFTPIIPRPRDEWVLRLRLER